MGELIVLSNSMETIDYVFCDCPDPETGSENCNCEDN